MIELIFATPVVAIVLVGGACLLYLCFAKVWVTRIAREGAICLQSQTSKERCRFRVEQTLEVGLPFGTAEIREFQKFASLTRVHIAFRFEKAILETDGKDAIIDAVTTIHNFK